MKTKNLIIGRTANGLVYRCETCTSFHVEYKNFIFNLTTQEYDAFTNYIINLNVEISLTENLMGKFARNITVPTQSSSLQIILNNEELNELSYLFSLRSTENMYYDISSKMNYNFCLS
ncbi:DUF6686 family protein [Urechidicola croceus]|uniref:Uncharacterized protein n=1 Tax=Urechidicola croceus TaxID=1850246 RepID=A0A1D8P6I8_9FLAO|nr:DUF6686 family protein [Urechidicola croceus]AOW20186.1 hypothetical protein LPB138_05600 [Urechidicola croceus]